MKFRVVLATMWLSWIAGLLVTGGFLRAEPYKDKPGPHKVETLNAEWADESRQRTLPVKLYFPADLKDPAAVIIFSHGLGGSREAYAYVGKHWASHGYVCIHLQHPGSDVDVWRGKRNPMESMKLAARDPSNATNRPKDVRFAVDQIEKLNQEDPRFKGKLDVKRIGMSGHSFGAYTTQAAAGVVVPLPLGREFSLGEPRIKAAIAMSPTATRNADKAAFDKAYAKVTIPMLHLTGTKDDSVINDTRPEDRRVPFDHIKAGSQYLVIFEGGDHMVFSGRTRLGAGGLFAGKGDPSKDADFQNVILQTTTAFWDAYLLGKADAKKWLDEGGFKECVGKLGTLERK